MEICRDSVVECEVATVESKSNRPPEPHPNRYRDEKPDVRDADFGTSQNLVRIYKKPREHKIPPPMFTGEIPKKTEKDEDSGPSSIPIPQIDFGFRGRWYSRQVVPEITEEELNEMASRIVGVPVAVT
jgi:hypothetical protein